MRLDPEIYFRPKKAKEELPDKDWEGVIIITDHKCLNIAYYGDYSMIKSDCDFWPEYTYWMQELY